jgi:hypothetical protein
MTPMTRAAATASVSYKTRLIGSVLKRILVTGQVPDKYIPHVHALLDDAPVSLLGAVAEQLHEEESIARDMVWRNYRSLARHVKSRREIWE